MILIPYGKTNYLQATLKIAMFLALSFLISDVAPIAGFVPLISFFIKNVNFSLLIISIFPSIPDIFYPLT